MPVLNTSMMTFVGFGPETSMVVKDEELRGASGVKPTVTVLEDGEERRMLAYGRNMLPREHDREAMENGAIHVQYAGLFCKLRVVLLTNNSSPPMKIPLR